MRRMSGQIGTPHTSITPPMVKAPYAVTPNVRCDDKLGNLTQIIETLDAGCTRIDQVPGIQKATMSGKYMVLQSTVVDN